MTELIQGRHLCHILLKLKGLLNLHSTTDANFWAACLVAFFGLLRKANLLPTSAASFKPSMNLSKSHFAPHSWGLSVTVPCSKTNQFKERELVLALPAIPGHPLCPVSAVLSAFSLSAASPPSGPAFWCPTSTGLSPLTSSMFTTKLATDLGHLGLSTGQYSGHSFRRGGASWALECGLPAEVIHLCYLHCPLRLDLGILSSLLSAFLSNHKSLSVLNRTPEPTSCSLTSCQYRPSLITNHCYKNLMLRSLTLTT